MQACCLLCARGGCCGKNECRSAASHARGCSARPLPDPARNYGTLPLLRAAALQRQKPPQKGDSLPISGGFSCGLSRFARSVRPDQIIAAGPHAACAQAFFQNPDPSARAAADEPPLIFEPVAAAALQTADLRPGPGLVFAPARPERLLPACAFGHRRPFRSAAAIRSVRRPAAAIRRSFRPAGTRSFRAVASVEPDVAAAVVVCASAQACDGVVSAVSRHRSSLAFRGVFHALPRCIVFRGREPGAYDCERLLPACGLLMIKDIRAPVKGDGRIYIRTEADN